MSKDMTKLVNQAKLNVREMPNRKVLITLADLAITHSASSVEMNQKLAFVSRCSFATLGIVTYLMLCRFNENRLVKKSSELFNEAITKYADKETSED